MKKVMNIKENLKIDEEIAEHKYNKAAISDYVAGIYLIIICSLIALSWSVYFYFDTIKEGDVSWSFFVISCIFLAIFGTMGIVLTTNNHKNIKHLKQGVNLGKELEEKEKKEKEERDRIEFSKKYKIISSTSRKHFEEEVNKFMNNGFKPMGEVRIKQYKEYFEHGAEQMTKYTQELINENI
jgi:uncharacterized protein YacL